MLINRLLSFTRSVNLPEGIVWDILLCGEINQSLLAAVFRRMPTFKAPAYSKQTNAKGQMEASYIFQVEYTADEKGIEFIADSVDSISVASIQACLADNVEWWNAVVEQFLKQSVKFFSKQYSVSDICKIIQHTIVKNDVVCETPCNVTIQPKYIQIIGGSFVVHWNYTMQPIIIDIPGLSDPLPVLDNLVITKSSEPTELNIDELPMNSTESIDLSDPNKLYEKQKVKEAILKAKVAYYRAQNQIRSFSDKYGDEYSDSEFELEDTENESESDVDEEDEEEDK